jgi:hypothetical protein
MDVIPEGMRTTHAGRYAGEESELPPHLSQCQCRLTVLASVGEGGQLRSFGFGRFCLGVLGHGWTIAVYLSSMWSITHWNCRGLFFLSHSENQIGFLCAEYLENLWQSQHNTKAFIGSSLRVL